jgi:hypothetical protein
VSRGEPVREEEVGRFCAVLEDLSLMLAAAANYSEQQQFLPNSQLPLIEQLQAIMREHMLLPELLGKLQELLGFKGGVHGMSQFISITELREGTTGHPVIKHSGCDGRK